jgi:DNA-binding HxlR family transcriptional regulator
LTVAQGLEDLSLALALRLRDLARVADRLDRLESGTGAWLASQRDADWRAAAAEMTLRALRAAADPTNFAILTCLKSQASASMADLEKAVGLGRLPLTERLNDLVQVGLAARNVDTDHAQTTAGGAALVGLLTSIAEATAQKLEEAFR